MTDQITLQTMYNETLTSLAQGKSANDAMQNLISKGMPEPNARMVVDAAAKQKHAAFRKAGAKLMGKGALMIGIGIAVTAVTYAMGLPIFIVAWGPAIFGAINFFKGLFRVIAG